MNENKENRNAERQRSLHRLNNSLCALKGFSALLHRHLKDDAVGSEYVGKLNEALTDALSCAASLEEMGHEPCLTALPSSALSVLPLSSEADNNLVSPPAEPELQRPAPFHQEIHTFRGCERLLVVEDNSTYRSLLEVFLGQCGYEIVSVGDGLDALDLFSSQPNDFDLVCLDLDLPRMNGILLAEKIRELRPRIRVVLLSGGRQNRMRKDKMTLDPSSMNFHAVLKKPVSLNSLAKTIRQVLDL